MSQELLKSLVARGALTNNRILEAWAKIPRGDFVPEDQAINAFNDSPLRLESFGFNISAPHMYCICLEALDPQPGMSFLDIGSGCGHMTALASYLVGEKGHVLGLDIQQDIIHFSIQNVEKCKKKRNVSLNCNFENRNCFIPDFENRKFDRIHCGASCPVGVLPKLIDLLNPNGILVTPCGNDLLKIVKNNAGKFSQESICSVRYGELILPSEAEIKSAILENEKKRAKMIKVPSLEQNTPKKILPLPPSKSPGFSPPPQTQENQESKKSLEVEYNDNLFKLRTVAKTITELENEIKSKLKLQQNDELVLKYNENGKMYVLDDMEDVKERMTIQVTISTRSDSSPSSSFSNLSISGSDENNDCWWNTKPNGTTKWEEKGYKETKYLRYLLRDDRQNVVDNGNEYLKKLELLMIFFGASMKEVSKAYVLCNQKLFDSFQNHRSLLFNQQRANPGIFNKDDWKNGSDVLQKYKFYDHYTKMAEIFDWNRSKHSLHTVPMIHGTSETALLEICQTGLAATGATDAGFYGQGMYFSSSLFYSSKYAKDSPDGKPFIICMVTPGNVYPVTESPYLQGPITLENPEGFIRRPCKLGYQSHYTLVNKTKFQEAYPITGNIDGNVANELVAFDKAQVLPLFVVYIK